MTSITNAAALATFTPSLRWPERVKSASASQAWPHDRRLKRLQRLAFIMDKAIPIPGTKLSLGADSLLGLVPVVGDTVSTVISLYALAEACSMGVPRRLLVRMLGNILLDSGLGALPLVGDIFDMLFKSNSKNLKLVLAHLEADKNSQ